MGFFSKIIDAINTIKEQIAQKKEEKRKQEEQRKEEERKKREEANRFNPNGKSLEWFSSEDGIKTYGEYVKAQNYILEESIKKEKETKYPDYDLDIVIKVMHKDAKLPHMFFKSLVNNIDVQALAYVGPTEFLIKVLSIQAKPFAIDEDGEPQAISPVYTPEEIVSVNKNPVLNFVTNFKCFELKDDEKGSWKDKYSLWADIIIWLATSTNKEIITNNPWIFSKETYFNDLGTVKKPKSFYKKCAELSTYKAYFEDKLNECE